MDDNPFKMESTLQELTPIEKGVQNENGKVASADSVFIHLKPGTEVIRKVFMLS